MDSRHGECRRVRFTSRWSNNTRARCRDCQTALPQFRERSRLASLGRPLITPLLYCHVLQSLTENNCRTREALLLCRPGQGGIGRVNEIHQLRQDFRWCRRSADARLQRCQPIGTRARIYAANGECYKDAPITSTLASARSPGKRYGLL